MNKKEVDRAIREKFRFRRHDIPPYTGWLKPSSRTDLYDVMNSLGCFKIGAEIGVMRGVNALAMLQRIEGSFLNLIDPWTLYGNWKDQEKIDRRYTTTLRRMGQYSERVNIIKKTSMEAVGDFKDESLDFVYIDGFHEFDAVMSDLIFWVPKVRPGGIIAGHDYYNFWRAGVVTAVDAYVKGHGIRDWYITHEATPSFFWVK